MSRREEYEAKTEALVTPIIERNGCELVDVEFMKEAGTWYLRIYADKAGGITIDDCENISRAFSDVLDAEDYIEESYIMEVSSPGLDRPLKKDKDFERSIGARVEIRLFSPIEKRKEFYGELLSYTKSTVTIALEPEEAAEGERQQRTFERKTIALIRLAFDWENG